MIPESLDEVLQPSWLTSAVRNEFPSAVVTGVENLRVDQGVATRARFDVLYAPGSDGDGLPHRLFLKGPFEARNAYLLRAGVFYREARFYREIAAQVNLTVPRCIYAEYDEDTLQGIVLLENILAGGAQTRDLGAYVRSDEARRFLLALARFHASTWGKTDAAAFNWIPTTLELMPQILFEPDERIRKHLCGPRGDVLPMEVRDPDRIVDGFERLLNLGQTCLPCVLHGDSHLGNLFVSSIGAPGWLDWQSIQRGSWAMDLAFYLVGSLRIDERRLSERSLIAGYLDALKRSDVAAPSFDEAWETYRRFIVHGLYNSAAMRDLFYSDSLAAIQLERFGAAARDIGTFGALGI